MGLLARPGEDDECAMESEAPELGPSPELMSRGAVLCYGTGHMLNDLSAACWFTYLLIFLTDIGISPQEAATVMLSGQVVDAIATVVVGQLIDAFGHFKVWHGGGSLLVAVSFSSVFGGCMVCALLGSSFAVTHMIGYSVYAVIFNIGWAATQVSHMSLVNCITSNQSSQVSLNSCRNAFTMFANLGLYVIAYAVFRTYPAKQACDVETQFSWIAGIAIATGCCFVLVFLIGVKEPRLSHHKQGSEERSKQSFKVWFRKLLYYQVAAVYMLTRLTTNVSQALLPFYLIDDLGMEESSKAMVPALIYACSFLASLVLQELRWTSFKLKIVFAVGAGLWVVAGAIFLLLPQSLHSPVYFLAVLVGIGNAFMLVTATSMEGLLVSTNLSGCGFVYGSLSFLDKLACGIALYLIESMNVQTRFCPREDILGQSLLLTFPPICHCSLIRVALALVPSSCALLAWVITATMTFHDAVAPLEKAPSPADPFASLATPLLLAVEPEGARPVLRLQGGSSSSCASAAVNEGTTDLEVAEEPEHSDIESAEPAAPSDYEEHSLWQVLGRAMVGRWGSMRPVRNTSLQ